MRLLPTDKTDLLVVPFLLWLPIAFLLLIGTQAAHTGEEVASILHVVAVVTAVVAVPFVVAVIQKARDSLKRR